MLVLSNIKKGKFLVTRYPAPNPVHRKTFATAYTFYQPIYTEWTLLSELDFIMILACSEHLSKGLDFIMILTCSEHLSRRVGFHHDPSIK